ncbi:MAG TPA: hypothetical protein PKE26_13780 [Kiritimatiellia bacterium]|nr:hypothetical protein [Kiritimatiellia bacterium]HMP00172.1 hypothetical protein [Kiritimatiellia bacterium]HMP96803.1 hypothetical protein [Kiritimatiellia bacterium]
MFQALLIEWSRRSATAFERVLAVAIIVGVVVFGIASISVLVEMDWGQSETFYEMMYRVLLMVIAVELARLLVTHNLHAILELLAFVVARKMLKPDITSVDILLSVFAFAGLLAAKRYLLDRLGDAKAKEKTQEH